MATSGSGERLLLTVQDVAHMLGLSDNQTYLLLNEGHLPYVQVEVSRKQLVPRSELLKYIHKLVVNQIESAPAQKERVPR